METSPSLDSVSRQQALRARIFWFLAGAAVNYLLISTPLGWLTVHTQMPKLARVALSLGLSTSVFFFWNYFVNFRTDSRKRDTFWRYLIAVGVMYLLSTTLLTYLTEHDLHHRFLNLNLDIVATQFFLAGVKFPLYHYWAFPVKATKLLEEAPK